MENEAVPETEILQRLHQANVQEQSPIEFESVSRLNKIDPVGDVLSDEERMNEVEEELEIRETVSIRHNDGHTVAVGVFVFIFRKALSPKNPR